MELSFRSKLALAQLIEPKRKVLLKANGFVHQFHTRLCSADPRIPRAFEAQSVGPVLQVAL